MDDSPVVVAVVDERPLVRQALLDALTGPGGARGWRVVAAQGTSAADVAAAGDVDVVVAADRTWSRGRRWVPCEATDLDDEALVEGLLTAVAAALGGLVDDGRGEGSVAPRPLTAHERAVLDGVERGLTVQQIADELGLSTKAVANAKARARTKLGVLTQVQAIRLARVGPTGTSVPR